MTARRATSGGRPWATASRISATASSAGYAGPVPERPVM